MEVSTLENVSFGRCLFCATMDVTAQHCSQQFRDGLEELFFFPFNSVGYAWICWFPTFGSICSPFFGVYSLRKT